MPVALDSAHVRTERQGIVYRPFQNRTPPQIVEVWNASLQGRSSVHPITADELESLVLAKPYFDPAGLIVAYAGERAIGFVHAGFGADESEQHLVTDFGVTAMIAVRPEHRRQGIGRELVRQAEAYLRGRGAQVLYAGCMRPLDPFYLGLYGGSEMPGVLVSDEGVGKFFESLGYRGVDESVVFQRRLDAPLAQSDARFPRLRRWLEWASMEPHDRETWWQAATRGPLEQTLFVLLDRQGGQIRASATAWMMEGFSRTLGERVVGLSTIWVEPEYRGQGLAKLLLAQTVQKLRDELVAMIEVQTMSRNQPARRVLEWLGCREVDRGMIYRLEARGASG